MKRHFCLFFIISILLTTSVASSSEQKDTLFQISTIQALMEGVYDGDTTCGTLKRNGDFGIGTFNGLDGEMVFIDGVIYRIPDSGKPVIPEDSTLSPFSVVTFFESDSTITIMNLKLF